MWTGARAGKTHKHSAPRFTRTVPVVAQGGVAGHAAVLGAPGTSRALAILELKSALEEELATRLGLERAPPPDQLVARLRAARLLDESGACALSRLLASMARVETKLAARAGGPALLRDRPSDAEVLAMATALRDMRRRLGLAPGGRPARSGLAGGGRLAVEGRDTFTRYPVTAAANTNEIAAARERIDDVRREVARVYVGSSDPVDTMLVALLARGHALLEGVPGVAKTTLVKAFATTLGCSARRIQFTPDLLPADITGTYVLSPREGTFSLRAGPVFANVVLADEINRAPAKTQSALLEAMQERQVTIEGDRFELPSPFIVLATENPVDLEGTYPLPEAQIDRFLVRVAMGYPSAREEAHMLKTHGVDPPTARPVLEPSDILRLQAIAARVYLEDDLLEYAVAVTTFTRLHPRVALGASPRATLGLVQAAKAWALIGGRPFVAPDDIRAVAPNVLAHRLVMTAEAEVDPKARERLVEEALSKVSYRRGMRAL